MNPSLSAIHKKARVSGLVYGGERGIRTLDTFRYTPLAGERLRPLGHLSIKTVSITSFYRFPFLDLLASQPRSLYLRLRPALSVRLGTLRFVALACSRVRSIVLLTQTAIST